MTIYNKRLTIAGILALIALLGGLILTIIGESITTTIGMVIVAIIALISAIIVPKGR